MPPCQETTIGSSAAGAASSSSVPGQHDWYYCINHHQEQHPHDVDSDSLVRQDSLAYSLSDADEHDSMYDDFGDANESAFETYCDRVVGGGEQSCNEVVVIFDAFHPLHQQIVVREGQVIDAMMEQLNSAMRISSSTTSTKSSYQYQQDHDGRHRPAGSRNLLPPAILKPSASGSVEVVMNNRREEHSTHGGAYDFHGSRHHQQRNAQLAASSA